MPASLDRSVAVDNRERRLQQDFDVAPNAPCACVEQVQAHHLVKGCAAAAMLAKNSGAPREGDRNRSRMHLERQGFLVQAVIA